ncbi:MAG: hypothetical protein NZ480_08870 [Bdellovibrionaceae bacterium]|nr:hypothetical protein [Pseudobdellovibrionaceae bacterium]MDW8189417.1 hypothetical protein [Pseudobdellovibrionaceae bacterium]
MNVSTQSFAIKIMRTFYQTKLRTLRMTFVGLLFAVACSPSVPKVFPEQAFISSAVKWDAGIEFINPKVDILFVVDDSSSMSSHQSNLAQNIARFLNQFVKRRDIDYQVGVITTAMGVHNDRPHLCCGRLVDLSGHRFVNSSTNNLVRALQINLLVGTRGDPYEMVFSPIMKALSPEMRNGYNKGFLRDDAHLIIVVISDAEDQSDKENHSEYHTSPISPYEAYQFLLNLKNKDLDKIMAYGVIVPVNDIFGCARDEEGVLPRRIEAFLRNFDKSGQNIFNLCDPFFGEHLVRIGEHAVRRLSRTIYLSRPPIVSSIRVQIGDRVIPNHADNGWVYDPEKNAIVLGVNVDLNSLSDNDRLKIFYNATEYVETRDPRPLSKRAKIQK